MRVNTVVTTGWEKSRRRLFRDADPWTGLSWPCSFSHSPRQLVISLLLKNRLNPSTKDTTPTSPGRIKRTALTCTVERATVKPGQTDTDTINRTNRNPAPDAPSPCRSENMQSTCPSPDRVHDTRGIAHDWSLSKKIRPEMVVVSPADEGRELASARNMMIWFGFSLRWGAGITLTHTGVSNAVGRASRTQDCGRLAWLVLNPGTLDPACAWILIRPVVE